MDRARNNVALVKYSWSGGDFPGPVFLFCEVVNAGGALTPPHGAVNEADRPRDGHRGVRPQFDRMQDRISARRANFARTVQRLFAAVGEIRHDVIEPGFGISYSSDAARRNIVEGGFDLP